MLGTPQDRRKWSVLSGLFLVYMASNGITLHTLPLLYPELIETFGWRASEVTLPADGFLRCRSTHLATCRLVIRSLFVTTDHCIGRTVVVHWISGVRHDTDLMATGCRVCPARPGIILVRPRLQHGHGSQAGFLAGADALLAFCSWLRA